MQFLMFLSTSPFQADHASLRDLSLHEQMHLHSSGSLLKDSSPRVPSPLHLSSKGHLDLHSKSDRQLGPLQSSLPRQACSLHSSLDLLLKAGLLASQAPPKRPSSKPPHTRIWSRCPVKLLISVDSRIRLSKKYPELTWRMYHLLSGSSPQGQRPGQLRVTSEVYKPGHNRPPFLLSERTSCTWYLQDFTFFLLFMCSLLIMCSVPATSTHLPPSQQGIHSLKAVFSALWARKLNKSHSFAIPWMKEPHKVLHQAIVCNW